MDDDIFNIMTLKLIIKEEFDITPDSATNGLEAIRAFKKKRNEFKQELKGKERKKCCSPNCPK